jgi:DNA-directed RNA polymerase I, II, and III subunit RPABC2
MSDDEYYSDSDDSVSYKRPIAKNQLTAHKKSYIDDPIVDDAIAEDFDDDVSDEEDNEKEDAMSGGGADDIDLGSDVEAFDDDDDDEKGNPNDVEYDEADDTKERKKQPSKLTKAVETINNLNMTMYADDDDMEDEEDDNYTEKFNTELTKNYILDYHPECMSHNYEEIEYMSNVVKNESGIVVDDLHRTVPYLTKYERARILGQRAKQIEDGAKPLVKVPESIIDSYLIAELELKEKRIPFIIKRPLPNGGCEYWKVKDLEDILF